MQLFLLHEHLEAMTGLLTGQISILLLSGNREAQGEGRDGLWPVGGAVRTDTALIRQVHCLTWVPFMAPKPLKQ